MKPQELANSISKKGKTFKDEKQIGSERWVVEERHGWMSKNQFDFLSNLAGENLNVYPKEGGYYCFDDEEGMKTMHIKKAMPNGARSYKMSILKERIN